MSYESKIREREEIANECNSARARGMKTGFSSGAFDLLHAGHVHCLFEARKLCDFLVVGVNSDSSVRSYKGDLRPINSDFNRAAVVAGLECVDRVFIFQEINTNRSIEIMKPDIYVKGGDYTRDRLSSAPLVEAYGGKVVIIPHLAGNSTTEILERIARKNGAHGACITLAPPERRPAVFLDRDGTIIEHVDYLHDPSRVRFIPGALDGIRRMRAAGASIVVITNQPGIGIGYFPEDDLFSVNKAILTEANKRGALVDRFFYCPHSMGDGCHCRKPSPGLVERAVRELNIDLSNSFVIGDMTSDIEMGRVTGCHTILVRTGKGGMDGLYSASPEFIAADLSEAASVVMAAWRQTVRTEVASRAGLMGERM